MPSRRSSCRTGRGTAEPTRGRRRTSPSSATRAAPSWRSSTPRPDMKVLVVGDTLARYTGLGYVALSLAARLRAEGHSVEYAVLTPERTRSATYDHYTGALRECTQAMKVHHLHERGFPRDTLDAVIGAFRPEKVLVVHDPW